MKNIIKCIAFTQDVEFFKTITDQLKEKFVIKQEDNLLNALVTSATGDPDLFLIDCDSIKLSDRFIRKIVLSENLSNLYIVILSQKDIDFVEDKSLVDVLTIKKSEFIETVNEIETFIQMKKIKSNSFYLQDSYVEKLLASKIEALGFNTKYIGTIYFKELVKNILYENGEISFLNSDLYPSLAFKYNTKVENIERNIRNAIKNAYLVSGANRFEKELKVEHFDCKFLANRCFVALFIEKFKKDFSFDKISEKIS